MPWLKLVGPILKVGLPILLVVGVALYINSLRNNVEDLEAHRDRLIGELAQVISAANEQRQENDKLREDAARANTARALADQKRETNELLFQERIDAIQKYAVTTEEAVFKSTLVAGDSFNSWFIDLMQRIQEITPTDSRSDQNREADYSAPLSPAETPKTDTAIIVAINRTFAETLQEKCDESRFDEDGLVDETREGNLDYCRWYVVGFPGQRVHEFQVYMERLYLYMLELQQWGQYYKDATQHFKDEIDARP